MLNMRGTNTRFSVSIHNLAIFSVEMYLILSMVFETLQTNLSRLSTFGLYFCILCCFLEILLCKNWQLDWYGIVLFIFAIILSVSNLWSPTNEAIRHTYLYRSITAYVVIILIGNVLKSVEDINIIINSVIIAGILLSLHIYSQFGFSNLASSGIRMGSEMGNQNLLGWYAACAIILSVYEAITKKAKRIIYLAPVLVCVPAVMFTGSRKAIIIILISVVILLLVYNEKNTFIKRVSIGSLFVLFLLLIIENIPAFSVINDRFRELTNMLGGGESQLRGDINRVYFLREGLRVFRESPLIGKGFCYSYYLFGAYSHNNYVELLLNHGVIGFLVYYYAYAKILMENRKVKLIDKKIYALNIMIIVAILVCDIGVVSYYNRFTLILTLVTVKAISVSFKNPMSL